MTMILKHLSLASLIAGGLATQSGPVIFEPSGQWHGEEGQWSTFAVHLGTPSQTVYLLPDPYRNSLVVIGTEACAEASRAAACAKSRGNVFNWQDSTSWHPVDSSSWDPNEATFSSGIREGRENRSGHASPQNQPLNPNNPNNFGIESVGERSMAQDWTVPDQGILSVSTNNPFVGRLGLASNLNRAAKNPTSFFDNVRGVGGLKGIAWSYTAGSRASNVPGSLIFGGYDATRLDPSTMLSFPMNRNNHTHSVVLEEISIKGARASGPQTVKQPETSVEVDFGRTSLHLPYETCKEIESALGLQWNDFEQRYTISDSRHMELLNNNAELSFSLRSPTRKQAYTIPYKALILTSNSPTNGSSKIFAMKPTSARFAFGRAFLQGTHMIAVFDDTSGGYFNISQAKYEPGKPHKIVEIQQGGVVVSKSTGLGPGAIAGIVIGVLAAVGIAGYLLFAWQTHRKPFKKKSRPESAVQLQTNLQRNSEDARSVRSRDEVESTKESVYYEARDNPPIKGDEPPQYAASQLDGKK